MADPLKAFIPLGDPKHVASEVADVTANLRRELQQLEAECLRTAARGEKVSKDLVKAMKDVKDGIRANEKMALQWGVTAEKAMGFRQIRREAKDWRGAIDLLRGAGEMRDIKDVGEVGGAISQMMLGGGARLRESESVRKQKLGRMLTRAGVFTGQASEQVLGAFGTIMGVKYAADVGWELGSWIEKNTIGREREQTRKETERLIRQATAGQAIAHNMEIGGGEAYRRYKLALEAKTQAESSMAVAGMSPNPAKLAAMTQRALDMREAVKSQVGDAAVKTAHNTILRGILASSFGLAGWFAPPKAVEFIAEQFGFRPTTEAEKAQVEARQGELISAEIVARDKANRSAEKAVARAIEFDQKMQMRALETRMFRASVGWAQN